MENLTVTNKIIQEVTDRKNIYFKKFVNFEAAMQDAKQASDKLQTTVRVLTYEDNGFYFVDSQDEYLLPDEVCIEATFINGQIVKEDENKGN